MAHVLGHLLSLLGLRVGGVFPRVLDTLLQRAEADVFALAFAATLQGRQQAVPGPRSANYKKARIENRPKHLPRVRDSHVTPNQRNGPCQPKVFFRPEEQLTDWLERNKKKKSCAPKQCQAPTIVFSMLESCFLLPCKSKE